jgi:hypothetical protein
MKNNERTDAIVINTFALWAREWQNAYNFFHSEGNTKTRSRLKTKWYNEFIKMVEERR